METLLSEITAIAKRKRVGKEELLKVIENAATREYSELKKAFSIQCDGCLRERFKQQKLDE